MKNEKKQNRYIFSLMGINIEKIEQRYGLGSSIITSGNSINPENTTKLNDLEFAKRPPNIVSFLDESKRLRKCNVSMVDLSGNQISTNYSLKCFWDRNTIPNTVYPLGCPVKYVASNVTKSYYSEISKDTYIITEPTTEKRYKCLEHTGDKRIHLTPNKYYETDGVFCSFNCMLAFIQENKQNPLYQYSECLALQLYKDLHEEEANEILCAPHWRTLKEYGGYLTIEQFRDSFNRVEYVDHGIITCESLGRLYEDVIKF